MAEMLESPLEHVFGDSFISLPRDVFSTVNADYAYEAGKLGCYLMETLQYHTKMHASKFGLRHIKWHVDVSFPLSEGSHCAV